MRIYIDYEELETLIDFQERMARDAKDSCQFEEAHQRLQRAIDLKKLRRVNAAS